MQERLAEEDAFSGAVAGEVVSVCEGGVGEFVVDGGGFVEEDGVVKESDVEGGDGEGGGPCWDGWKYALLSRQSSM